MRTFSILRPTGYKALNTDNLDDPAIALPTDNFNTVLYTGDNTDGRSITGVGFEPNFVWQKNRSSSLDHVLYDNVRTVGKELRTNTTGAETFSGYISSFNSDGFTVNTGGSGIANSNGGSHVAWNWKGSDTPSKTFAVTVTNPGSGNRYTLDGKVSGTNAMPITIEEGGTYTFDQSDNSNSGHPLRFSTTANGTHGGGSEYTTGVTVSGTPGSAGAKTVITVAASAATLYFYCTAHSGMGAQASTPGSGGGVSDLVWYNRICSQCKHYGWVFHHIFYWRWKCWSNIRSWVEPSARNVDNKKPKCYWILGMSVMLIIPAQQEIIINILN